MSSKTIAVQKLLLLTIGTLGCFLAVMMDVGHGFGHALAFCALGLFIWVVVGWGLNEERLGWGAFFIGSVVGTIGYNAYAAMSWVHNICHLIKC
jgi:hypothetical protein